MGRLDRRVRRLAQQVKDTEPAREQARLARMSHEELLAELTKAALVLGMPEELAHGGLEAIKDWGTKNLRKAREKLPEKERDEGGAGDNDEPALDGPEQPVGKSLVEDAKGEHQGP